MRSWIVSVARSRGAAALAALAYFAAVALALTHDAIVGRAALGPERLLDRDALYASGPLPARSPLYDYTPITIDYPRDLAFAQGVQAGRLDAWNPLAGCGAPLWADHGAPFFPLKLPFYVAPSRATYQIFLALRLVLAAAGAYFLARAHGLAFAPALAAGVTFEVSGAMLGHLQFASSSPVYVLPWIVLGAEALARGPGLAAAAKAGLALGLAGHGGHPALILLVFGAFAAAIGATAAARARRPREAFAIAAWAFAAVLLGLALAAPALLPLAELTTLATSYKARAIGAFTQTLSLTESRAGWPFALFTPGLLAHMLPGIGKLHPFGAAIGVLALAIAVVGLLRRGAAATLVGVAILGLALAVQPTGLGWFARLPGVSLILPSYAWALVTLFLAQAIGRGVQSVASERDRWALPLALALVAGAALLALPLGADPSKINRLFRDALASPDGAARVVWPAVVAVIAVAVCFAAARTRFAGLAALALAVLLPIEPAALLLPALHQPTSDVLRRPESPTIGFLREKLAPGNARMMGLSRHIGRPLTPMLFGLRDFRNVAVLQVVRLNEYLELISPGVVGFNFQEVPVASSPLLDLAAVRYVVTTAPSPRRPPRPIERDSALRIVHRDGGVVVYENQAALERVRIVHGSVTHPGPAEAAAWLAKAAATERRAGDGVLGSVVGLESNGATPPAPAPGDPAPRRERQTASGESVRIVQQPDPDRLLLEAVLSAPGYVVIADTYYPGWKAWVDGRPAPIFPADLLFRAIAVPAGSHAIELRYEPRSLRYGAALFGAAAAFCAWALWRERAASSRRPSIAANPPV